MIKFLDLQKLTDSFEPDLSNAIERVIRKGWFVLGEEVVAFEKEYADYIGSKHCIGVANGLDALRLIFRAYIELGKMAEGDEVIVPANTFIASILSITENRLKPVLVEPNIQTYNIDITLIEQHISPKTKAIMIVHLYGNTCWSEELVALAEKYDLKIIEDNAQATGAQVLAKGLGIGKESENLSQFRRTGSLGNAAGHSFYPGKNLGALGDGGAITTDEDELAEIIRALANYGSSQKYIHDYRGFNSRLDEIQAAVLRIKMPRLDHDNVYRQGIAQYYIDNIKSREIIIPGYGKKVSNAVNHVWHLFVIRHPQRDKLQNFLTRNGIQTLIHYPVPPHKQMAYKSWNNSKFKISERIHEEVLSLPISPVITTGEIDIIIENLKKFEEKF